jgi:uncharacterized damage-inducible protein DinB
MKALQLAVLFLPVVYFAQAPSVVSKKSSGSPQAATPAPGTPRGVGFKPEFLTEMSVSEMYLTQLAERIPAEKYTWRPAEGVRSISEVLLHVSAANYRLPRNIGSPPPDVPGLGPGFDKSTTDKQRVLEHLKASFAHVRQAVERLPDADAEKKMKWFGGENTYRGFLFFVMRHLGEHTGQLIAYARMNGITPPWTEERQRGEPQSQKPSSPR